MLVLAPSYKPALETDETRHQTIGAARLLIDQFQHCGFLYASRKYLALALLLELPTHLEVARALALPQNRELVKHHPQAPFKYLLKYLARSFDIHARSAILANHYRYLGNQASMNFIDRIGRDGIPLWQEEIDGHRYGIGLSYPKNEEGELMLTFSEDGVSLYTLSFTVAPGHVFNTVDEQVLFIGRLQGVIQQREAIKRTSKAFHELIPAALLLAALRGIAASLHVGGLVGVAAQNQICMREARFSDTARSTYDEFWISAGGEKIDDQAYYLPVVQTEKPLSEIKNNHRSRVKRKRQIRNALTEQIAVEFGKQCLATR